MKDNPHNMVEDLTRSITKTTPAYYLTVLVLGAFSALGLTAFIYQLAKGLGVTGMNNQVTWGVYITNFVFFIGISHAGTFVSAILRLTGAEWRRPFTRSAEAITLFSLPFGAGAILVDLGRFDRFANIFVYGRLESPLLWDTICLSAYLLSSTFFFYLCLLPDIAACRDKVDGGTFRKWLWTSLSLGWHGDKEQRRRLEKAISIMAIVLTLLVVTVHTVVSWVFSMTIRPGWHSTIIGPYFLVGAVFSGAAMLMIILAICRKVYGLERYLKPIHFEKLGKILLVMTLAWFYMTVAEYLTEFYGNLTEDMEILDLKFFGQFSLGFWAMVVCCFIVPLAILVWKKGRSIAGCVSASVVILIGMWLERFLVVVPTLAGSAQRGHYVGVYDPSWVEWSIAIGSFSAFFLLFVLFAKFFPIISAWELEEGEEAIELEVEAMKEFLPGDASGTES